MADGFASLVSTADSFAQDVHAVEARLAGRLAFGLRAGGVRLARIGAVLEPVRPPSVGVSVWPAGFDLR